ncbi:hypothetical protein XI09_43335 [Bradyrhizobium sp. CCBAU 11386]|uniref:hypothetical protein n=1 Tax=Bradyrhizobium sp. CCBAU 11386 TaxID=1630837 RepID=UPI002303C23F|nr:hypothetical protein [Bradyrhizobium sp. CCBAU 11386]MDA9511376.1 hypothetical protein [Bradyrhizobium sp. CCBAU 11386]
MPIMILLFHRDTLPFDFLDVKSEAPEHIEAVALADFGVVVMGSHKPRRVCNGAFQSQRKQA